jgi:hypothetical protein
VSTDVLVADVLRSDALLLTLRAVMILHRPSIPLISVLNVAVAILVLLLVLIAAKTVSALPLPLSASMTIPSPSPTVALLHLSPSLPLLPILTALAAPPLALVLLCRARDTLTTAALLVTPHVRLVYASNHLFRLMFVHSMMLMLLVTVALMVRLVVPTVNAWIPLMIALVTTVAPLHTRISLKTALAVIPLLLQLKLLVILAVLCVLTVTALLTLLLASFPTVVQLLPPFSAQTALVPSTLPPPPPPPRLHSLLMLIHALSLLHAPLTSLISVLMDRAKLHLVCALLFPLVQTLTHTDALSSLRNA